MRSGGCWRTNQFGTRAHAAMLAFRNMIEELAEAVRTLPLNEALKFIEERTGYRRMLEQENSPEAAGAAGESERIDERRGGSGGARRDGDRISGSCGAGGRCGLGGRNGAGHADDDPQRQGAGVSGRVSRRHGRGPVSAQPVAATARRRWKRSGGSATSG